VIILKPEQKCNGREWAKDHLDWDMGDFSKVIYSNKVCIILSDIKDAVWVTWSADEVYNDDCVIPKFKQSSLRMEYPGGFGGGMTAARYQEQVLDKVLHDFYQSMAEKCGQVLFQQDGAPSHTTKSMYQWLDIDDVERMPHP
jgi:hypothetical protein